MTRLAILDDWPAVQELWREFKSSKHSARIEGDELRMSQYFIAALTNNNFFCIVTIREDKARGFAVGNVLDLGLGNYVTFLRAIHMKAGSNREERAGLQDMVMAWSKVRGIEKVMGFCNYNFPLEAYERLHGVKPMYTVVFKEVK